MAGTTVSGASESLLWYCRFFQHRRITTIWVIFQQRTWSAASTSYYRLERADETKRSSSLSGASWWRTTGNFGEKSFTRCPWWKASLHHKIPSWTASQTTSMVLVSILEPEIPSFYDWGGWMVLNLVAQFRLVVHVLMESLREPTLFVPSHLSSNSGFLLSLDLYSVFFLNVLNADSFVSVLRLHL